MNVAAREWPPWVRQLIGVSVLLTLTALTGCAGIARDNANIAASHYEAGRYDKAIAYAEFATTVDPSYAPGWHWLGQALKGKGQFKEAIQALKKATELDPNDGVAHNNLGAAYLDSDQYDQAIQALKRAIKLTPNSSTAHHNLGVAYGKIGQYDQAIQALKRAIELGGGPSTQENLQWAYKLNAKRYGGLVEEGRRAEESGQLQVALKHYTSFLQHVAEGSEDDWDLRRRVIRIAQRLNPPLAIPEEANRHAAYARTAAKEAKTPADFEKAIDEYQKALRIAPWWGDAYLNLALVQEQSGKYADAVRSLELFLLAAPNDPEARTVQNKMYELEYKAKKDKTKR